MSPASILSAPLSKGDWVRSGLLLFAVEVEAYMKVHGDSHQKSCESSRIRSEITAEGVPAIRVPLVAVISLLLLFDFCKLRSTCPLGRQLEQLYRYCCMYLVSVQCCQSNLARLTNMHTVASIKVYDNGECKSGNLTDI